MTDSKTVVEDLAAWLTAVWDEEERLATEAADRDGVFSPHWTPVDIPYEGVYFYAGPEDGGFESAVTRHIGAHDPASVLARIAADREILGAYVYLAEGTGPLSDELAGQLKAYGWAVQYIAEAHRDRPGFRSEWLVERQGVEQ